MNNIKNRLKCGILSKEYFRNITYLTISRFKVIYNEIIPLFNEYNIKGVKALDFKDFCFFAE
uniref:LAGLIDADG endonuclease n=1 Tax=Gamarada debralockiae TaxID=2037899 RepID=A0A2U8LKU1_9HELO|nr:LAGLIDADG endonuclease [Gamarada debralockiae]